MNEHTRIQELLAVYRDLDDEERRQVDQHIRDCAACAGRLAAYRAMDRDLAGLPTFQPDEKLRKAFYDTVTEERQESRGLDELLRPLRRVPALAGQAVGLAALLLLMAGLWFTLRGQVQPGAGPVSGSSAPVPFETWSQGQPLPGESPSSEPLDPRPFLEIVNNEFSLEGLLSYRGSHPAYWPQKPIEWDQELLLGIFQPLQAGYRIAITHITRQGDTLHITTEVQPSEAARRGASLVPQIQLAYHLVTLPRRALPADRFRVVVTDQAGRAYQTFDDTWFNLGHASASIRFRSAPSSVPSVSSSTAVPEPEPTVVPSEGVVVHEIEAGDTVVGIAKRYGLTVDELGALNDWPPSGPTSLAVGQPVVVGTDLPPQLVRVLPAPGTSLRRAQDTAQPADELKLCGTWDVSDGGLKGAAQLSVDEGPPQTPSYVTELRRTKEDPPLRQEACWEVDLPAGRHTATFHYSLADGRDFAYHWNFSLAPGEQPQVAEPSVPPTPASSVTYTRYCGPDQVYGLEIPVAWYDLGRQPSGTDTAYAWSSVQQANGTFRLPPGELYLSVRMADNPEGLSLVDWGRQAAAPSARVKPAGPLEVDRRPAFKQIEDADPPLIETEPSYKAAVYVGYAGQVLELSALAADQASYEKYAVIFDHIVTSLRFNPACPDGEGRLVVRMPGFSVRVPAEWRDLGRSGVNGALTHTFSTTPENASAEVKQRGLSAVILVRSNPEGLSLPEYASQVMPNPDAVGLRRTPGTVVEERRLEIAGRPALYQVFDALEAPEGYTPSTGSGRRGIYGGVVYVADGDRIITLWASSLSKEGFETHRPAFEEMVQSLHFDDVGAPPPSEPLPSATPRAGGWFSFRSDDPSTYPETFKRWLADQPSLNEPAATPEEAARAYILQVHGAAGALELWMQEEGELWMQKDGFEMLLDQPWGEGRVIIFRFGAPAATLEQARENGGGPRALLLYIRQEADGWWVRGGGYIGTYAPLGRYDVTTAWTWLRYLEAYAFYGVVERPDIARVELVEQDGTRHTADVSAQRAFFFPREHTGDAWPPQQPAELRAYDADGNALDIRTALDLALPQPVTTPESSPPLSVWVGESLEAGELRYRLTQLYAVPEAYPSHEPGFRIKFEPANDAARASRPALPMREMAIHSDTGTPFQCFVSEFRQNLQHGLTHGYIDCIGELTGASWIVVEPEGGPQGAIRIPLN